MGACCASDNNSASLELKTIEDKGLLVLEFGDNHIHWSNDYPQDETYQQIKGDASVSLVGIDSRHKKGYTPLAAIRLAFSNGTQTDWFETEKGKKESGEDIEEISTDVDDKREIREIAVRVSMGN